MTWCACQAFERMFASRQNKLSMFEAIQRKSIICVNTSDAMLKDASPLFGRYMIASTMAAVFERVAVPEREWNQAYLIIDEAASYFDESLEKLLAASAQIQARRSLRAPAHGRPEGRDACACRFEHEHQDVWRHQPRGRPAARQ